MIEPERWMRRAACANSNYDADLWFPEPQGKNTAAQARRICQDCPVKRECLDYALRHKIRYGIWGGYNREERWDFARKIAKPRLCRHGHEMKGARCYTCMGYKSWRNR